ncbi:aldo/keto reductase [Chloroflexi bacterium]|nr:aldo/keto reductase [Chloroflexota bacterium]
MLYRRIKELEFPAVGMGTSKTFDIEASNPEAFSVRSEIVRECQNNGVTLVDSSPMYGTAEKVLGLAIQENDPTKFQIATKVWTTGYQSGQDQIDNSFSLLRTDYIHIFQIHNLVDWKTHLPILTGLKDKGKVGLVGLTCMTPNDYPEMMSIMKTGKIDSIQIPYNAINTRVESHVLPLAESMGIGVLVMEPLQKGKYVKDLQLTPNLSPLYDFGIKTWAQALISWVISNGAITTAIPATSNPKRIKENALGAVQLPKELRNYIKQETERCI